MASAIDKRFSNMQSPVSDIIGLFGTVQHNKRCRGLELNVLDCLDVYGLKGMEKYCKDEFDDYRECITNRKQLARVQAMQAERMRQYLAGERSKKDLYAKVPKVDGFEETYGNTIG